MAKRFKKSSSLHFLSSYNLNAHTVLYRYGKLGVKESKNIAALNAPFSKISVIYKAFPNSSLVDNTKSIIIFIIPQILQNKNRKAQCTPKFVPRPVSHCSIRELSASVVDMSFPGQNQFSHRDDLIPVFLKIGNDRRQCLCRGFGVVVEQHDRTGI